MGGLGGGMVETGWLSAARWLPYHVLVLLVGALVDRARRRPVMIVSDLVRMVLLVLIPLAAVLEVLSVPLLLGVVLAYGAASPVNDAASMSFLPRLVPRGLRSLGREIADGVRWSYGRSGLARLAVATHV